jgi:hypothetical protein
MASLALRWLCVDTPRLVPNMRLKSAFRITLGPRVSAEQGIARPRPGPAAHKVAAPIHCLPEPLRESSCNTREPTPWSLIMHKKGEPKALESS